MDGEIQTSLRPKNAPWRITGQKRPLKPKDVWAIRVRLQLKHRSRGLALFNFAIDSKLRGCDLMRLQVDDVCADDRVRDRATVIQKKTSRPVQFEITEQTRARSKPGFRRSTLETASISSRAASGRTRTSRHGSMQELSTPGSRAPGRGFPRAHQRPLPPKKRAVHHHGRKPRGRVVPGPSRERTRTAR